MSAVTGWDVGGANIKAARIAQDGKVDRVVSRAFALWREPSRLSDVLAETAISLEPAPIAAVTMTAELADCFATRREGVHAVLDAIRAAMPGVVVHVWSSDSRFRPIEQAYDVPHLVAAANWLATATWAARRHPDAILIDVGSTTTDIVPIVAGRVCAAGYTDPERLASGELVYTGILRTPVCAIVRRLPWRGTRCRVAAEHFAIAGDAHLWLGRITPAEYTCDTPDGRGTTRAEAGARLARMVCADSKTASPAEITAIARHVVRAQRAAIVDALRQVRARLGASTPGTALVAGTGRRIAREAARRAGLAAITLEGVAGGGAVAAAVAGLLWASAAGQASMADPLSKADQVPTADQVPLSSVDPAGNAGVPSRGTDGGAR